MTEEKAKKIPIAKPFLGEEEALATHRPILSGWVTQGPEVEAFEKEFAMYTGTTHACAVSNCTVALYMALLTVGVQPGSEVITASHSFIATANAVRYTGAKPVFIDIDPATFNMDAELVERAISEKTSAILCVHQLGMPCNLARIVEIGREYQIPVVEDAACAIGSEILWDGNWEKIGRPHGEIACFSFHPRKVMTTGDGGMLTTNNADYDRKFRLLRQHGMSVSDTARHRSNQVINESYILVGHNFRMTDIQAAVGREQLKRLPQLLTERRVIRERYDQLLKKVAGVKVPAQPEYAMSNWQSYCVRLPERVDQRNVMQMLLDKGIATRRGVMCAHREPAYPKGTWLCGCEEGDCDCNNGVCEMLRESEKAQDNCLILPLFNGITVEEQERVVAALKTALT